METRQRPSKRQNSSSDRCSDETASSSKEDPKKPPIVGVQSKPVPTLVMAVVILSYSIALFVVWRWYPSNTSESSTDHSAQTHGNDLDYLRSLGWHLMKQRELDGAKIVFEEIISKDANDRTAIAALASIYNTQGTFDKTLQLLTERFESGNDFDDIVIYRAYGEALIRDGQTMEAYDIHSRAVEKGLLKSVYQRPMEYIDNLRSQPWWTAADAGVTELVKELEKHWMTIRDEALNLINVDVSFSAEKEDLTKHGNWKQLIIFNEGRAIQHNCKKTPTTCGLLSKYHDLTNCKRCQVKYSLMQPGTQVWPHCGPSNSKLRLHLGLQIPDGAKIRVADTTRSWNEGKTLIFDDSYEHEIWNDGERTLLTLMLDIWHPDITEEQKTKMLPRRQTPVRNN